MDMKQESEMSLVGHLTELRSRIIICLVALIFSVVGSFFFARPILDVLTAPINRLAKEPGRSQVLKITVLPDKSLHINDPRLFKTGLESFSLKRIEFTWPANPATKLTTATLQWGEKSTQSLYYSKPMDPFMMMLKVALIAGILVALPILIWQIWMFIKPGLKKKERAIVKPLLSGAVFLFPVGAAFAYYMVALVLRVMQAYAVENVNPLLNVFDYISLLFNMMLIFGFIFEIPLALAIASRIGLVTPSFLARYRRHAYVILAVAAMVISPGGDPFTMVVALVPLVVLYEVSIALSIAMARLHKRDQEASEDEEDEEQEDASGGSTDFEDVVTPSEESTESYVYNDEESAIEETIESSENENQTDEGLDNREEESTESYHDDIETPTNEETIETNDSEIEKKAGEEPEDHKSD